MLAIRVEESLRIWLAGEGRCPDNRLCPICMGEVRDVMVDPSRWREREAMTSSH